MTSATPFVKMHGLGNDFVVFDGVTRAVHLAPERIRFIADRHFGVGCDQVLLVEPPWTADAQFSYRIFNADGGEVGQCGNGARCFARFVREQGLSREDEILVDTRGGRLVLHVLENGDVRVNMGIPRHRPEEIPFSTTEEAFRYRLELEPRPVDFGAVSMGNPHAVIMVDDIDSAPVAELGPLIESHPAFPERVNVGFMSVIDSGHARLRVFERGVGETLACGSGACAAAVVGIESAVLSSPVRMDLPGGTLQVSWAGRGHPVFLTGPAVSVFQGEIQL